MEKVTIDDIRKAQDTIKDIVKRTDILESTKLSLLTNANIYYKCENLQKTGSFKVRGACNKIANLTEEEKSKGVCSRPDMTCSLFKNSWVEARRASSPCR